MTEPWWAKFKAKRLGTVGRKQAEIALFTTTKTKKGYKMNSNLQRQMKANPKAYKMPLEYIWNTETGKVEPASDWFKINTASRRVLKDELVDEFDVHDNNFIDRALAGLPSTG